jgi:extradiol dioxygenase family protein
LRAYARIIGGPFRRRQAGAGYGCNARIARSRLPQCRLRETNIDGAVMGAMHPFHLAFPVTSLAKARAFYGELLGCPEGRSSPDWVDFDFYGHQIVAHLSPDEAGHRNTSAVDGDNVPVRHFGVVLSMSEWEKLADKLRDAGTKFVIEPHIRFKGQVGEQATMFFLDPCGNALEFKAFSDPSRLFAK